MTTQAISRQGIYLAPGDGRPYQMGRMAALFKADGDETEGRYTVSEWWLEPHTQGPGAHNHDEDDLFYVLEGTMSFLLGDRWIHADRGAFVLIPGRMTHNFENRSDERAGILNFGVPGDFEKNMPAISQWFQDNPPGDA
jgi:mannose-6-phosphate isomerase-like protein (cupin superfamily)